MVWGDLHPVKMCCFVRFTGEKPYMCELGGASFTQSRCVVLCVPQERSHTCVNGVRRPSSSQDVFVSMLFCVAQERSRTCVSGVGRPSSSLGS